MTVVQRQTAVTAHLKSKQLLLSVFAWQHLSGTVVKRQIAVSTHLKSKQLQLFASALQSSSRGDRE